MIEPSAAMLRQRVITAPAYRAVLSAAVGAAVSLSLSSGCGAAAAAAPLDLGSLGALG